MYNDGVYVEDFPVDFAIEFLFCVVVVEDFGVDSLAANVCDNVAVYFYRHLPIVVSRVCLVTFVASATVGALAIILEQP